jgi:hypothetical protein
MLLLAKNSLLKEDVWDGVLSWRNSQLFCCESLGWIFMKSQHTSQDEFFVNNPLDVRENNENAVALLFTCLAFFGMTLGFSSGSLRFLLECLSDHRQGLHCTFSDICIKCNAVPLSGTSQNRIRPDTRFQIKEHKKSACPPSCMKFCTMTPKIWYHYHLPLHHAITTAVQKAAPVPEIMDTPRISVDCKVQKSHINHSHMSQQLTLRWTCHCEVSFRNSKDLNYQHLYWTVILYKWQLWNFFSHSVSPHCIMVILSIFSAGIQ